MALPIFNRLVEKGKEEPEYFLALEITETHVKSAAWIVANGQTEVVATGSPSYWQGKDAEELVTSADSSLAGLAQKLTTITQKEPSKVIFGLPALWVGQDNKILEEKGSFLKNLTKKLELIPIGFVVTSEALVQYLKDQEGIPPSAIFVGLEDEELEVTLIHLGKVIGRTRVARSVDLGADLEEGLTRFLPQAILPNRILLFNGHSALEESRQQLINHPWRAKGSKLPFLHFPKVEILSEEETIKAVAVAGGAEAARAIGLPIEIKEKPLTQTAQDEIPEEEVSSQADKEQEVPEEVEPEVEEISPLVVEEPERFGFVKGQDIQKVSPLLPVEEVNLTQPPIPPATEEIPKIPQISKKNYFSALFSRLTQSIDQLRRKLFLPRFSDKAPKGVKGLGIIALSTVAVFLVGLLLWWNFAKATITLEIQARTLTKESQLQISPKATEPDSAAGILPGSLYQGTANDQQTLSTTGQKLVGTKSKGTIVVFNNTSQEVNLKSGTQVISDTGLKFLLDNATTVASPSGTAENPTPGQTSVTVTSADVGPEYNLAGGTSFSVPGFSSLQVVAKNQDAFAGGDKRQVQAVSKEDKDKLSTQLTNSLSPKARESLSQNVPPDYQLVGNSISFKTTIQTFDKNVGDEGTSLTLSETVSSQAIAIPKASLAIYLSSVSKDAFSDQFEVSVDNSTIDFGDVKLSPDGSAKVSAKLKIVALPKIDTKSLASQVSGKSPSFADRLLSHTPGFVRQESKLTPELPGILALFPFKAERITIEIKVVNASQ